MSTDRILIVSFAFYSFISLGNFFVHGKNLVDKNWWPGKVAHPTQKDAVSCGVYVLKVVDLSFKIILIQFKSTVLITRH